MSNIDQLSCILVEISKLDDEILARKKRIEILRAALRQYDRSISYDSGMIAAYEAVFESLSDRHQKMVEKRIDALKLTRGEIK